jgi:hypothetical protein
MYYKTFYGKLPVFSPTLLYLHSFFTFAARFKEEFQVMKFFFETKSVLDSFLSLFSPDKLCLTADVSYL